MAAHTSTTSAQSHPQPGSSSLRQKFPILQIAIRCVLAPAMLGLVGCTQLPNPQRDRAAALHAPGYAPKQGSGIPTAIAPNLQQNSPLRLTDASSAVLPSRSDP